MAKAECDRKVFLMKCVPFFSSTGKLKFDQLYKSFIAIFLPKGVFIFKEGQRADTLYVVYQGQCSLHKNTISSANKESDKNIKVMNVEKGDLLGLEAINFMPSDELQKDEIKNDRYYKDYKEPTYKYSLKAESDSTILISVRISSLGELREAFKDSLTNLKNKKEHILEQILSKKEELKKQFKVRDRAHMIRDEIKNNYETINHKQIEGHISNHLKTLEEKCMLAKNCLKPLKLELNTSSLLKSFRSKTERSATNNVKKSMIDKIELKHTINTTESEYSDFKHNVVKTFQFKNIDKMFPIRLNYQENKEPPKQIAGNNFLSFFQQVKDVIKQTETETTISQTNIAESTTVNNKETEVTSPLWTVFHTEPNAKHRHQSNKSKDDNSSKKVEFPNSQNTNSKNKTNMSYFSRNNLPQPTTLEQFIKASNSK
jgi:hypothetical protein